MAQIIDGIKVSKAIKETLRLEVEQMTKKPTLAVVIAGDDPASKIYVGSKKKACDEIGIQSVSYELPGDVTESELLGIIKTLNENPDVNGILVQLPLPAHICEDTVLRAVSPQKDVDCFHPANVGLLTIGQPVFLPCTPAGIIELLKSHNVPISGANCVVIGRSNIVGKPAASLLLAENGTVTICHSRTKNLAEITKQADILVAAVGKPKFVTADMIKDNAVVIDVGVHNAGGKKRVGDVDFDSCFEKASMITPVPGGVGPMTIAMLMKNCVKAASWECSQ